MYLEALYDKTVGIAGCGGLGSNCAVALARAGVGKLVIADFDIVCQSNLNRQYYFMDQLGMKKVMALRDNLLRIRPDLQIEIHDVALDPESILHVFSSCQVIAEAFDQAAAKQMIIETVLSRFDDKYLVCGVGLAGWGMNESLETFRDGRLIICGDRCGEVSASLPPLAPRVGIVAHMQANVILELLLGPCSGLQECAT